MTDKKRIKLVLEDLANNARRIDGMLFDGKNMGNILGGLFAYIECIGEIVERLLDQQEKPQQE